MLTTKTHINFWFIGIILFLSIIGVFLSFSAKANHFVTNKNFDVSSWIDPDNFRCGVEKLKPAKLKDKGEKIRVLQRCLESVGAGSTVKEEEGIYGFFMQESVKWFYEHHLDKKSDGKKFTKKAIQRMKELAKDANAYLNAQKVK